MTSISNKYLVTFISVSSIKAILIADYSREPVPEISAPYNRPRGDVPSLPRTINVLHPPALLFDICRHLHSRASPINLDKHEAYLGSSHPI